MKTGFEIIDCKYLLNQEILKTQRRLEEDILMMDEAEYNTERDKLLKLFAKREALQWVLGQIKDRII